MILVFLYWILCFLVIFSCGYFITRLYAQSEMQSASTVLDVFIVGFITISIFTSYLSIWISLDFTVSFLVLLFGLVVLFRFARKIFSLMIPLLEDFRLFDYFLLIILTFYLLLESSNAFQIYDTELYHSQSIQWIKQFSVIPGLGNLHGRLAFNSMFFPISSLFAFDSQYYGNWPPILIYPLNGLICIVFVISLYGQILKEIRSRNLPRYFFLLCVFFLVLYFIPKYANSPSADSICALLIIYSFSALVFRKNKIEEIKWLMLLGLIITCITYKLSSLFVFLLFLPSIFLFKKRRYYLICFIIVTMIMCPFLIRNYYLSGYLIYPFPSIDVFEVDWKIPISKVVEEKMWIESWARIPEQNPEVVLSSKFTTWFSTWFDAKSVGMKILLLMNFLLILTFFVLLLRKKEYMAYLVLSICSNLVFWFITAPDPRFVYGFLIVGFSTQIGLLSTLIKPAYLSQSRIDLFCRYLLPIGIICLILLKTFDQGFHHDQIVKYGLFPYTQTQLPTRLIKSNFTYSIPIDGNRCYNHPIPCAPEEVKRIEQRNASMKSGFRIRTKN